MKEAIVSIVLLITAAATFCQQTNSPPIVAKQDYLLKSKKQKKAAKILLGGGGALTLTGILLSVSTAGGALDPASKDNSSLAAGLGYGGAVIMAGSIPFFISSSKNKRKAMSISFKNQSLLGLKNGGFAYKVVPSVSLKIDL